ncbi:helix-turn-helix transcriptional regulator [Gloeocapsopsis dulcis]|uniref:Transcriptional regulator n=1 Tax=Gloeocapsopsis dulcis AAB1 = 1H9 TaxID=1433147 RepID=A0A6N8G0L5_9CHRO|nr:metalloregulator ArsR/SmtB family transcription factor [Gloeocapsopsis dulcis]MUL38534.1 transcriptional regulator [Gloeocapsopsis dulcis AAB1 = 1H9]WNN90664.1 transcriptional regulator [Gloeocapsopsis dulcis]
METNSQKKSANIRTRRAIVNLLKQQGATDAQELASHLGISAMAVRQHLYALQEEKLITYQEEAREMGRPAKLWQLTPAADRLFPDGYADLTLSLINSVKEAFGDAGLEQLLNVRTRHQIGAYQSSIPSQASLEQRLEVLAALRTEEGYMAEIQALDDDCFLLIENHCPICAAATACTGLCAKELEIFQSVLGEDAVVERTEHIISGERRCVYQVSRQG